MLRSVILAYTFWLELGLTIDIAFQFCAECIPMAFPKANRSAPSGKDKQDDQTTKGDCSCKRGICITSRIASTEWPYGAAG